MLSSHRDESFSRAITHIKQAAEAGHLHEAQEQAALACALWPEQAEGWLWRAWLCEEPEQALGYAQEAVRLEPGEAAEQALRWVEARLGRVATVLDGEPIAEAPPLAARAVLPSHQSGRVGWFAVAVAVLLVLLSGGHAGPLIASETGTQRVHAASRSTADTHYRPSAPARTSTYERAAAARQPGRAALETNPARYVLGRPTLPAARLDLEGRIAAIMAPLPLSLREETRPAAPSPSYALPAPRPMSAAAVEAQLYPSDESSEVAVDEEAAGAAVDAAMPITSTAPVDASAYALWPARMDALPYQVQAGDNPISIAEKFGLRLSTLIWANESLEENAELLSVGQELLIPALDGVLHTIKEGDTLTSIGTLYSVDASLIAWFPGNHLKSVEAPLTIGERLMVPGGRKPYVAPPPAPAAPQRVVQQTSTTTTSSRRGYFVWPTGGRVSQYSNAYHIALDIAAPMGTPIYASAGGTIVYSGWDNSGYGYTILLDHGNGWRTRYAHLSGMYFEVNDRVSQGELIALMGSTGRSTGPHLHFEILYKGWRYNPLDYLSR